MDVLLTVPPNRKILLKNIVNKMTINEFKHKI